MTKLLYYNMMSPTWLSPSSGNKADWSRANRKTFLDLGVKVGTDTMPYEKICTVPLLSSSTLPNDADITIRVNVGMQIEGEMNEVVNGKTQAIGMPKKPRDPVAIMITDGSNAIGMVIQDLTKTYDIEGPYYGIQGTMGGTALTVKHPIGRQITRTTAKNNPDEIRFTFKPSEYWGLAYSPLDGGHKDLCQYNVGLTYKNGLNLQICRIEPGGEFIFNYIEVTITHGSQSP